MNRLAASAISARSIAAAVALGALMRLAGFVWWPPSGSASPPTAPAVAQGGTSREDSERPTVPSSDVDDGVPRGQPQRGRPSIAGEPGGSSASPTDARGGPDWSDRDFGSELADTWERLYGPVGAADAFLRAYGDVPVHPIGRPRNDDGTRRALQEPLDRVRRRVSDVNVPAPMPEAIRLGRFVAAGWRLHDRIVAMAGNGNARLVDAMFAQILVAQHGRQWADLDDVQRDQVSLVVVAWTDAEIAVGYDVWRAAWPEVERRLASGRDERDVVGFIHAFQDYRDGRGRLVLLRAGEDPELDRLLRERELLDLELETDLARILGR